MADKNKMTVAEMLAAARKADNKGDAPAEASPPATETPATDASSPGTTGAAPPPAPVKKAPAGGKSSTADILAMARAKSGTPAAASAPAAKEAPKPAPKPVAAKAAPAKKEAAAAPADTQSILAAARKSTQPGPMTKKEAAAKGVALAAPVAKKTAAKETIVVPPMPVKPDYAKPKPDRTSTEAAERRAFLFGMSALAFGFATMSASLALWTLGSVRFMFPNVLRLPPSRFKVGFPDTFAPGQVEEKYKAQFGVWLVNTEYNGQQQIVALKSVCTHLGCTPNWLEAEQKFKCPCHGSGFYKDGINFEGPAPRPLERYAILIAGDGQIEVDKSRTYHEEMGQWSDAASFIPA